MLREINLILIFQNSGPGEDWGKIVSNENFVNINVSANFAETNSIRILVVYMDAVMRKRKKEKHF